MSQVRINIAAGPQRYAPIGLSVYSRLNHITSTIEALKRNTLAPQSELYVFSDAPKLGDEEKVAEVRRYLKGIDGFRTVNIVERQENSRVKNNRGGHRELLDKYGRMIWLEEDIVTAPGFLEFMNQALAFYEQDERIFSVTGYCPPIDIPADLKKDVFVLKRFNAWGFGIWKNRYDKIDLNLSSERGLQDLNNAEFIQSLMRNGMDIPKMLLKDIRGEIDALDVKVMYLQALNGWFTLYPRKSFVQNIGNDGTGLHCRASAKFLHEELWNKTKNFKFSEELIQNSRIVSANYKFRFEINEFTKDIIINNILKKLIDRNIKSISLWGANNISALLIPYIIDNKIKINFIVDKKSEQGEFVFDEINVVPISKALKSGEKNFILCSINHIDSMRESLRREIGNDFDQFNLLEII